ncbi:MAG: tRNA (N(6)-L-threonylcarbamoyladenosine(37)-C(2))-methylthiotransferase MtaB [Bdellovibrionales bacterium RBG_16_40_8]|nr:MAG: tRNA (N(6)-L-threonylcarbamoyladenosine(37)-C(2))-methylthiotransferase MtaB [Bdellovibrionales bacterium RBG_16_40_8]
MSYQLKTFGCKVNTYDSGLLEKRLSLAGYENKENPKVHVLNTCAVTSEATAEALRTIRKIKLKHPKSIVVVTGCAAQVDTEKFLNVPGVDLVIANSHKSQLETLIYKYLHGELSDRAYKSNIFKKEDLEEGGGTKDSHTRSFLKIQDGCNSFCTYCVIPFARGKSRSLSIESIRLRANELLLAGSREIVLTGVHIGDYEFGIENLIEDLLLRTRVSRLRLTSFEPIELTDRLMELFSDPRLCPHFHMSIQSASTKVLSRMKRKYTSCEVEKSLKRIANQVPGAFVGIDVIAGFPGEGDFEFSETVNQLESLPWTRLHVFPYSERPGTYAIKLDGKNFHSAIASRADFLRKMSNLRICSEANKQVGSIKKVLWLKNNIGISRDYWSVKLAGDISHIEANTESKVKICALEKANLNLIGEIVK